MTVKVSKPAINVREELADLRKPTGIAGEAMLRAETPQEQFNLIGAGRKNIFINGDMRIAQRATSISTIGTGVFYSVDRWAIQTNKNHTTHTWAQVADAPSGFYYSAKLTVGTGAVSSGSDYGRLMYYVEGYDAQRTNFGSSDAKAVTLSFWTKSSVTGTFGGVIKSQFASPYPGFYFTYTINSANTWEYKTVTVPAGTFTVGSMSSTNGIGLLLAFDIGEGPNRSASAGYSASNDGGTLGVTGVTKILATSGATWQITGVQLELGKVATPFEHRSYGEELALCQRYYNVVSFSIQDYPPASGYGSTHILWTQTMRVAPAVAITDGTKSGTSGSNTSLGNITDSGCIVENQTSGNQARMLNRGGTLAANAEL